MLREPTNWKQCKSILLCYKYENKNLPQLSSSLCKIMLYFFVIYTNIIIRFLLLHWQMFYYKKLCNKHKLSEHNLHVWIYATETKINQRKVFPCLNIFT